MGSWKEIVAFSDLRDRWTKPVVLRLEYTVELWIIKICVY